MLGTSAAAEVRESTAMVGGVPFSRLEIRVRSRTIIATRRAEDDTCFSPNSDDPIAISRANAAGQQCAASWFVPIHFPLIWIFEDLQFVSIHFPLIWISFDSYLCCVVVVKLYYALCF